MSSHVALLVGGPKRNDSDDFRPSVDGLVLFHQWGATCSQWEGSGVSVCWPPLIPSPESWVSGLVYSFKDVVSERNCLIGQY